MDQTGFWGLFFITRAPSFGKGDWWHPAKIYLPEEYKITLFSFTTIQQNSYWWKQSAMKGSCIPKIENQSAEVLTGREGLELQHNDLTLFEKMKIDSEK